MSRVQQNLYHIFERNLKNKITTKDLSLLVRNYRRKWQKSRVKCEIDVEKDEQNCGLNLTRIYLSKVEMNSDWLITRVVFVLQAVHFATNNMSSNNVSVASEKLGLKYKSNIETGKSKA